MDLGVEVAGVAVGVNSFVKVPDEALGAEVPGVISSVIAPGEVPGEENKFLKANVDLGVDLGVTGLVSGVIAGAFVDPEIARVEFGLVSVGPVCALSNSSDTFLVVS